MKQLMKCVLLAAVSLSPVSTSDSAEPTRLRVLSYNIHHAEGVDRKLDVDRIAGVILSIKPDLVALQEVDQKVKRTGSVDQPAVLARLTEMNVVFGANIELQGGTMAMPYFHGSRSPDTRIIFFPISTAASNAESSRRKSHCPISISRCC